MPRKTRIIIPGQAHHITQRGNNCQRVFENPADYLQYCAWLNKYAAIHKVGILSFCLMPNHVHLIMDPQDAEGIGRLLNTVQMHHAQYMNKKRRTSGHLWQGRYFSCILDDAHLYRAIRYVERNPVRANMVPAAWEYPWSSAHARITQGNNSAISLKETTAINGEDWKAYLQEADEEFLETIRIKTQKGLAIGSKRFLGKMENRLGKILHELKPGRPGKLHK